MGLNGVGAKAVNALSTHFTVESYREGEIKRAQFERGDLVNDEKRGKTEERNGTMIAFRPDRDVFKAYSYRMEHVERLLWNYAYLNTTLALYLNGEKFKSENGLKDLLTNDLDKDPRYPIVHLVNEDIEVAITTRMRIGRITRVCQRPVHAPRGTRNPHSGRPTFVVRDFFGKDYDAADIRGGISAAIQSK